MPRAILVDLEPGTMDPSGLDPSARSSGPTTSCLVCRGDVWALAQWAPFLLMPWGSLLGAWGGCVSTEAPKVPASLFLSISCQPSGPCPHSSKARVSLQRLAALPLQNRTE